LSQTIGGPATTFALNIVGSLTRGLKDRLSDLGADILERDEQGRLLVRTSTPSQALEELPEVTSAQSCSQSEDLNPADGASKSGEASSSASGASADLYEAMTHPTVDLALVSEELERLGATVIASANRVIRFTLGSADLARISALEGIAEIHPAGVARLLNDKVRSLIHVGLAPRNGSALDGAGELAGVADSGLDDTHPDFAGRIRKVIARGRDDDGSDEHGHGTHVSGTIAGSGSVSNGQIAGMAPAAEIMFQSVMGADGSLSGLPFDLRSLFQEAYDEGVRVHNNSWGAFLHGRYTNMSNAVDSFVRENPDFLAVIAAGNNGSCQPGANVGDTPGFVDWPSMSAPATAKNGLTVGASRSSRDDMGFATLTYGEAWPRTFDKPPIRDEKVSGDTNCLAAFSGRGPSDDYRVKPDVVAPGTDIASTRSAKAPLRNFWGPYPGSRHYALMGGTSMACPAVAGLALLVRQHLRESSGLSTPSAALLKAIIVNGADLLTGPDASAAPGGQPSYHQGFGCVDLVRSIPDLVESDLTLAFADIAQGKTPLLDTGDVCEFELVLRSPGELRLCLAWTDIAGRALQNGLMLILIDEAGESWFSNSEAPEPVRFSTLDPLRNVPGLLPRDPNNNVHVIRLPAAAAGRYTVSVIADNLLEGPQDFALAVTGPVETFQQTGN
jgi:subtilisin family serine protease